MKKESYIIDKSMYPAETSLIPVVVALTRFIEENGIGSVFGNYPFWYLGTTPLRFLVGPVVPFIFAFIHKLLASADLFEISLFMLILSYFASAVGWGIVIRKFSNLLIILLLIILPWRAFSSLAINETTFTLARNFLPWVLLAFWKAKRNYKGLLSAILLTSFLLLINTNILPILLVGVVSLALARSFKKGKFKNLIKNLKFSLSIIFCSLFFVTLWYTPDYWITILGNPSIGGASGLKVILRIFDLLRASVPLIMAIVVVYFSGKVRDRFSIFAWTWTLTFLFLTVFRFLGDPDFWMDWSTWGYELEVGIALIVSKINHKQLSSLAMFPIICILLLPFYFTWRIYLALGKPTIISSENPEGVRSLETLNGIAGDKNVFLSGSTVFWANAFYNLHQVRGGRDEVSKHAFWDRAAYEIREGKDITKTLEELENLGVSYVLVHGQNSKEFYHDFRNSEKWERVGEKIWEEDGDVIYRVRSN